jgi:broad specificity phosphatase PhoE
MVEFWLVRHGQTDWNLTGRWQGQASFAPGLNETGRAQVQAMRDQVRDGKLSAVYSSDLPRARQTAELIAEPLGLTVTLEPRLREIDLGLWEGMRLEEIERKYAGELDKRTRDPFHSRAPHGESLQEVVQRVLAAMDDIARKHLGESVLIVSHGISLAVIICRAEGFPMQDVYQHIPDNARPYRIQWQP